MITFFDKEKPKRFEFLTNNPTLSALEVANLYKKRWQIETLFKRIKQNLPLKYFLGDNENAIKNTDLVRFYLRSSHQNYTSTAKKTMGFL